MSRQTITLLIKADNATHLVHGANVKRSEQQATIRNYREKGLPDGVKRAVLVDLDKVAMSASGKVVGAPKKTVKASNPKRPVTPKKQAKGAAAKESKPAADAKPAAKETQPAEKPADKPADQATETPADPLS